MLTIYTAQEILNRMVKFDSHIMKKYLREVLLFLSMRGEGNVIQSRHNYDLSFLLYKARHQPA